jgi:hypothetical protein
MSGRDHWLRRQGNHNLGATTDIIRQIATGGIGRKYDPDDGVVSPHSDPQERWTSLCITRS